MKSSVLISLAVAATLAFAADDHNPGAIPPVLRPTEPADSVVFRLPPPPTPTPAVRQVKIAAPAPEPSPSAAKLTPPKLPALPVVPPAPAPRTRAAAPTASSKTPVVESPQPAPPAAPLLPPDAAPEMAFYCQKRIGQWNESDARKLLGAPLRSRSAFDEQKKPNGKIYAFHDPSGKYRELELDFEAKTGHLRTVFVYPQRMTWQDVRRQWHGEVSAADAQLGRKFYSYINRHLDVLVDAQGKVISLGLY